LSGDEIIFGDIRVREPERRLRPDRDRRFVCLAYQAPADGDLPIFLDRKAADLIERHALSDTSVELGGILLGKECLDQVTGQPFVFVSHSIEAKHYANTQASFTYTHDSWEEITRERDQRFPDFDIVGWYHTHPSFGIFLSHHDLFIHQNFFAQPLQVAYVVDPINQTRGFFQWRNGGMAQVSGYYLSADRGDRVALARLVNDLEKLPNPEGNLGGGMSPRLEAELIKMLSRPAHRDVGSPAERAQMAAVFGLMGMMLGLVAVAAFFWVYQQGLRIEKLTESIQTLSDQVAQQSSSRLLERDTLMDKVGGDNPAAFIARYEKTAKARDDAVRQLENQRTTINSLSEDVKELKSHVVQLAIDLESAQKFEKDAAEVVKTRKENIALAKSNEDYKQRLDELLPLAKTTEGEKALDDQRRALAQSQLLAYIGWGFSIFLALALAASYFLQKPVEPPAPVDDQVERPPHHIV
jgi:proteasome lid subunit RPN8/RPN11